MKTVTIESPFAGDIQRNKAYLQDAIRWACQRGISPYASHQMLTEALNDLIPEERDRGIRLGLAMSALTDESWFFIDHGMSSGMKAALSWCRECGRTVRFFSHQSTPRFAETTEPSDTN